MNKTERPAEEPRKLSQDERETATLLRDALLLAKDGTDNLPEQLLRTTLPPRPIPQITRTIEFLGGNGLFEQTVHELLDSERPVTVTLSESGREYLEFLEGLLGEPVSAA